MRKNPNKPYRQYEVKQLNLTVPSILIDEIKRNNDISQIDALVVHLIRKYYGLEDNQ